MLVRLVWSVSWEGACVALKMTVVGDIDVILLRLRTTGAASFYARCVWRWTKRTKTTKYGGLWKVIFTFWNSVPRFLRLGSVDFETQFCGHGSVLHFVAVICCLTVCQYWKRLQRHFLCCVGLFSLERQLFRTRNVPVLDISIITGKQVTWKMFLAESNTLGSFFFSGVRPCLSVKLNYEPTWCFL